MKPDAVECYLKTVRAAFDTIDVDSVGSVVEIMERAFQEDATVFTFGNGASAALASHVACDLSKGSAADLGRGPTETAGRRLRVLALNDGVPVLTAYANDIAYEDTFLEPLKTFLRPGDVVVGISGSGGSPNVLRALEYAHGQKATTIGLTGLQPKAALMKEVCDVCLQAPSAVMEQIEDLHVVFFHAVATALRARIAQTVS
jgi:D-sedoheptulose 7-phosphate isomerase